MMMAENQLGGGQETDKGDGETFVVMVERRNEEEGGDKSEEGGVLLLIDVRTQLWPGQSRLTRKYSAHGPTLRSSVAEVLPQRIKGVSQCSEA